MTEASRRFPAPWRADEVPRGYVVRDASGAHARLRLLPQQRGRKVFRCPRRNSSDQATARVRHTMLATGDLEDVRLGGGLLSAIASWPWLPGRSPGHEALPEVGPATNGESRSRDQIGRRPRVDDVAAQTFAETFTKDEPLLESESLYSPRM